MMQSIYQIHTDTTIHTYAYVAKGRERTLLRMIDMKAQSEMDIDRNLNNSIFPRQ